jgi:hypothetical protein
LISAISNCIAVKKEEIINAPTVAFMKIEQQAFNQQYCANYERGEFGN